MQHNTTANVETMPGVFQDLPFYTAGLKDVPAVFFYLLISVVMHAIIRENLLNVSALWDGYPHNNMTFLFKFFFIIQISYWLHIFPELYFQKTKKEDMPPKIQYATLYLIFITAAYMFRFTRLSLVLLVVHYLAELVFHTCRILAYAEKTNISSKLYKLGDLLFVLARLSSVILTVLP